MNKRRDAPAATGGQSSAKKRKVDNLPKFYAVKAGFQPGVYENYADCQAQTAGFKGALFKSFTTRKNAEAYVAGKKVESDPDEKKKFYAVAVGSPTGIFTDWSDASLAITGVKGPKYKRFDTRAEAVEYIKEHGDKAAIEAIGETVEPAKKPAKKSKSSARNNAAEVPADNLLRIYTDGSSLANGRHGARAGVGVYFGDGDPRNLSERLQGEPQTNQRAELTAMLRAMEIAPLEQTIQIISDSQYSINCVTLWAPSWKKKGWVTAQGEPVKNQDIVRLILDKMEERTRAGSETLFQWVKGHDANKGNNAADVLAVRGSRMEL